MTTHTQIVRAAQEAVMNRVAAERYATDDWSDADSHDRYVKVLRGITVYAVGSRKVRAEVPDTADGRLWAHVASEALDSSAQFDDVFTNGHIRKVSPTRYLLTF